MKLKLIEIVNLSTEINGDQKTNSPGLLREGFDYSIKANIDRLNNLIKPELATYDKLRQEILEKFGTQKGNLFEIKKEYFEDFGKAIQDLENVEKDIDVKSLFSVEITTDVLHSIGQTKGWYPIFQQLITPEEKPEEKPAADPKKLKKA